MSGADGKLRWDDAKPCPGCHAIIPKAEESCHDCARKAVRPAANVRWTGPAASPWRSDELFHGPRFWLDNTQARAERIREEVEATVVENLIARGVPSGEALGAVAERAGRFCARYSGWMFGQRPDEDQDTADDDVG